MKKILLIASGIAAVFAMIFGASAHANPYDPYAGQTYAKVQERTQGKAVIASRTGSYLPTEECIVSGSRQTSFLDSSGNGGAKILVDLNCNDTSALKGHPGNSVTTPEGKNVQVLLEKAKGLNANYAQSIEAGKTPGCLKDEDTAKWCANVCTKSGACSAELAQALGL